MFFSLLPLQGETSDGRLSHTRRFALRRAVCRLPLRGVANPSLFFSFGKRIGIISHTIFSDGIDIVLFLYIFGLKVRKAHSSGQSESVAPRKRYSSTIALQGQKRSLSELKTLVDYLVVNSEGEAETAVEATAVKIAVAATGYSRVHNAAAPAAATRNAALTLCRSLGIGLRTALIIVHIVPIVAALPYVAAHVV